MLVTSTNSCLQVEDFSNLDGHSGLKAYGGGWRVCCKDLPGAHSVLSSLKGRWGKDDQLFVYLKQEYNAGTAAQSGGWATFPLKDTMNWKLHHSQEWGLYRERSVGTSPVPTGSVSRQGQGLQHNQGCRVWTGKSWSFCFSEGNPSINSKVPECYNSICNFKLKTTLKTSKLKPQTNKQTWPPPSPRNYRMEEQKAEDLK